MEECGDILVFVKYDKNQTVGLWKISSQSLQNLVKHGQYWSWVYDPCENWQIVGT